MLLVLALQVAAQPARVAIDVGDAGRPANEQRRSVLADGCGNTPGTADGDIVVCGTSLDQPRLPDPENRGPPDGPVASNPNRTGIGALRAEATPCAATQRGCPGGLNLIALGTAVVKAIKGE